MEQRIRDLEAIVEALVKQYVDDNKIIIETNHDLISEINDLKQVMSQKDVSQVNLIFK